ncbi:condensation domain-containing protein [Actinophytocola glycyrrhizae]|uniref:Condensation domain-containing protein n=1 Tax=Actinophytocola glycyrrhizae TaxID=2044873 RepID=A0ABV9S7K1_9PSEU
MNCLAIASTPASVTGTVRIATALVNQPFDLAEPPVRADLVRVADDEHLLVLAVHHIAVDGWSVGVLSRDLGTAYRATSSGAAPPAPPVLQFADFAAWQRAELDGDRLPALLSWWRNRLTGAETLRLPTDRPRPAVLPDSGDVVTFDVPAPAGRTLRRLGSTQGATPFVVMLSVFAAALAEVTGQHDLSIGTVVSGRPLPELAGTVGPFVNTIVLRLDDVRAPTFPELVGSTRRVVLDALAHQDAPFEKVVEAVNPPRDTSRTPLFQVAFGSGVPGARTVEWSVDGLRAEPVTLPFTTSKYDMTLDTEDQPDGSFRCRWHYATALYDRSSVDTMVQRFLRLAHGFAADRAG